MRQLALPLAKAMVTFGGLIWLVAQMDFDRLATAGWPNRPIWLAVAVVGLLVQMAMGALRWSMTVSGLGYRWSFSGVVRAYVIGIFFSMFMPGSTLTGDAIRVWEARCAGLELSLAVGSVIIERVASVLMLAIIVLADLPWLLPWIGSSIAGTAGLCAFGLCALSLVVPAFEYLPASLRRYSLLQGLGRIGAMARSIASRPVGGAILANALVSHMLMIAVAQCVAMALMIPLSPTEALVLVPPVLLATMLPFSIGGWGVREGAMVVVLGGIGIPAESALMLSVWLGLLSTLVNLPSSCLLFAGRKNPDNRDC